MYFFPPYWVDFLDPIFIDVILNKCWLQQIMQTNCLYVWKLVPTKSNQYGGKSLDEILVPKNQTKKAGNWLQTCSDIFCGKYISMKNWFQQNQPDTAGRNTSLVCETWVPTKFSNLSKSRTKQPWQTKKIIGLKVPGHGLNGTILEREHQWNMAIRCLLNQNKANN